MHFLCNLLIFSSRIFDIFKLNCNDFAIEGAMSGYNAFLARVNTILRITRARV